VIGPGGELIRRGLAAERRAGFWWGFGIVVFALLNMAFWPSFESSNSLAELEESMGSLLEAFGAQGISTPAGYLDGELYALLLPLLLSGAAIAMTAALTAGDEDAGRLELLHALPIRRTTLWLGRLTASLAMLGLIVVATAGFVTVGLHPFSLDEAGIGSVIAATFACGALGAFHAAVAYAVAGLGGRRGVTLGGSIAVLVAGYVVTSILPLADALEDAKAFSPWYWAIGVQPVSDGVDPLRLLLLLGATAALVALGTWGVQRRDIRAV
jgi:ABC-2 type transport system permease protein